MTIEKCAYCGEERELLGHHESYSPEIIIQICHGCHSTINGIVRLKRLGIFDSVLSKIDVMKLENGRGKYKKSEHNKKGTKQYKRLYVKHINFYTALEDGWGLQEFISYNQKTNNIYYQSHFYKKYKYKNFYSCVGDIIFAVEPRVLEYARSNNSLSQSPC